MRSYPDPTGASVQHKDTSEASRNFAATRGEEARTTPVAVLVRRARRLAALVQLAVDRRVALAASFAAIPGQPRSGDVDLVAGLVDDLGLVADLLKGDS